MNPARLLVAGPIRDWTFRGLRSLGHQHWVPFGVRDRVIRRVVPPGAKEYESFSVPFFGQRYSGSFESYIDWSVYFYGAYERGELLFFRDLCRSLGPGLTILDIGANVGHHTLLFASEAKTVHAFEPWAVAADLLERRVAENHLSGVQLHRVGLGQRDEELPFYAPASENHGTGSFTRGHSPDNALTGTLTVRQGDTYLRATNVDHVDLIKLDVEGFEVNVLTGLGERLAADRPVIVMEYLPSTAKAAGPNGIQALLPKDYDLFGLTATVSGYRRDPFDPARQHGNILASPRERTPVLPTASAEPLDGGRATSVLRWLADRARRVRR